MPPLTQALHRPDIQQQQHDDVVELVLCVCVCCVWVWSVVLQAKRLLSSVCSKTANHLLPPLLPPPLPSLFLPSFSLA